MRCVVCTEHHMWNHQDSAMCAQNIISGIVPDDVMCAQNIIGRIRRRCDRCLHRTSCVESYDDVMSAQNITSRIRITILCIIHLRRCMIEFKRYCGGGGGDMSLLACFQLLPPAYTIKKSRNASFLFG